MTQEALKALIEDLRLNHEYCPKEVILQAADELERLAQRKPLTDEEIDHLAEFHGLDYMSYEPFARAVEAAHGIKENT